jgi:glucose/mannose-6-phosphate isomerase
MNLNDPQQFQNLDPQNMLAEIDSLPDQLNQAWEQGQDFPLPHWDEINQVLIAGMGGSAIGADLLAAYVDPLCSVPVVVHRDYDIPLWASGSETLVITSSHSGNTEETCSAFEVAVEQNCRILTVTTGGKLAARARETGAALWQFEHDGQPRAAVGLSFGLLLAAFYRLGLIPPPEEELEEAVRAMKAQQIRLSADIPVWDNPAKQQAQRSQGKWVTVMGAGCLNPVARRWKGQISEIAKAWGQFESLPEADHNTLAGVVYPPAVLENTLVWFLHAESLHERIQLRIRLTQEIFAEAGLETDLIQAQGDTRLAQLWTSLHLGDYLAYYLAMLNETDPTPVDAIEGLKRRMSGK